MAQPLLAQRDPDFRSILKKIQRRLRRLFETENALTLPLPTTSIGGLEVCLVNLLETGDEVVIGVTGESGERLCEVASRIGALVTRVDAEPGTILDEDLIATTIERVRPKVVALVHADVSTGVRQPIEKIAAMARTAGALVVLDCVSSLAGIPVAIDDWGVDAAFSSTGQCLSCSPGLSPASFSDRAVERARTRLTPVHSWLLDINVLADALSSPSKYCHSVPISSIFALDATLQRIEDEGMPVRTIRHNAAATLLLDGLAEFGFEPFVRESHRLPMLTCVRLPEKIQRSGEASLRHQLMDKYGIEVGGGLRSLEGEIWRIGLMGENARLTNVEALLCALRHELG
jgi:alanine-glyoxylate transaminase/serine-glyoxylate transaminase/serine-pyruvate transaminase